MPISEIPGVLDSLGISYALIGGRALIARGYVRLTVDFDFLTTDERVTGHVLMDRVGGGRGGYPQGRRQ